MAKDTGWKTFTNKEKVKARKVTKADGEQVVTSAGPVPVNKGDYVIRKDDGTVSIMDAESFEATYKGQAKKSTAKKTTTKTTDTRPTTTTTGTTGGTGTYA